MNNGKGSDCSGNSCSKLSVCNLGMSLGIIWGLHMLLWSVVSTMWGFGTPFIDIFSTIYIGFTSTVVGTIIGVVWGFVHGFIYGALIAFLYNYCKCKCPCAMCKKNRKCN